MYASATIILITSDYYRLGDISFHVLRIKEAATSNWSSESADRNKRENLKMF